MQSFIAERRSFSKRQRIHYQMKESARHCLNCGKEIKYGRIDKRYCDDICRARDTRKRNKENQVVGTKMLIRLLFGLSKEIIVC
ncbi:DUF2116 family Zn-ribbon domain-containing protein [Mucilaginibacter sp. UR6-11]|uniref:DUF2116 family Zn-ribbon domain-containing protein n=1 Tax=Mucilaginibacter sp. UR6-11 TaxID=1435644 RepID=UPI00351CEACF